MVSYCTFLTESIFIICAYFRQNQNNKHNLFSFSNYLTIDNFQTIILDIAETIKCSSSPDQFGLDFIAKSKLAKILECNENWAANKWTVKSLLLRGDGEWKWKANFVDDSGLVKNTSDQVKFSQESIS